MRRAQDEDAIVLLFRRAEVASVREPNSATAAARFRGHPVCPDREIQRVQHASGAGFESNFASEFPYGNRAPDRVVPAGRRGDEVRQFG
jgi:hypothetical protein